MRDWLAARAASGRMRNVWICFAIAYGGWTTGEVISGYQDLVARSHRVPLGRAIDDFDSGYSALRAWSTPSASAAALLRAETHPPAGTSLSEMELMQYR